MTEAGVGLLARGARQPLAGELRPPGDKSISHRALILATLAEGETRIGGLLNALDVGATASACTALGATIEAQESATLVGGVGLGGLTASNGALDMGNSGTAMRLLAGVLAAQPFDSVLVGDDSLMRRPMERVAAPLRQMGAVIRTGSNGCAPLKIEGGHELRGISYRSPVASAQVKSCVLLAGLYASGVTRVIEPAVSRDHTERMLRAFGADMAGETAVRGGGKLSATDIFVPADISSAAFFMAAAALVPDSHVVLRNVGLNPTRAGILQALDDMGCDLRVCDREEHDMEPFGDVEVRWTPALRAVEFKPQAVPSAIDELPVLMVVAALAGGVTRIRGAGELRVKESDRIAVMAAGLKAFGIRAREFPDGIDIQGRRELLGERPGRPVAIRDEEIIEVDAAGDHRCAMSLCVLAQALGQPVRIRNASEIDTSYPGFVDDLKTLGGSADFEESVYG